MKKSSCKTAFPEPPKRRVNTNRFPENGMPGQYSSTAVLIAGPMFLILRFSAMFTSLIAACTLAFNRAAFSFNRTEAPCLAGINDAIMGTLSNFDKIVLASFKRLFRYKYSP